MSDTPTRTGPESIGTILARLRDRDAAVDEFVAEHPAGISFAAAPAKDIGLTRIVVSPDTATRGAWRVTRFDKRGPAGHIGPVEFPRAVRIAVEDFGVDLAGVEVARLRNTGG